MFVSAYRELRRYGGRATHCLNTTQCRRGREYPRESQGENHRGPPFRLLSRLTPILPVTTHRRASREADTAIFIRYEEM